MSVLCEVTNVVQPRQSATASPVAGPSKLKLEDFPPDSPNTTSRLMRDDRTPSSELETASESGSEWQSTDCSLASGDDDGDRTVRKSSRRRTRRSTIKDSEEVNTIFFGTPSKEEIARMAMYQAKLRNRRVQRKDSIELARRKSAGSTGSRSSLVNRSSISGESRDFYSAPNDNMEKGEKRQATTSSSDAFFSAALSHVRQSSDQDRALVVKPTRSEEEVEGMLTTTTHYKPCQFDLRDPVVVDPDATEDADWFGLSSEPAVPVSSDVSPPSTPTRQGGLRTGGLSAGPLNTPSDADSSPGVALASSKIQADYSPLDAYKATSSFTYTRSPLAAHTGNAVFEPLQLDKENAAPGVPIYSPKHANMSHDSPHKANSVRSPWLMSPSKADLRGKLAAWADARVFSPISPAKSSRPIVQTVLPESPCRPESALKAAPKPGADNLAGRESKQQTSTTTVSKVQAASRESKPLSKLPVPTARSQLSKKVDMRMPAVAAIVTKKPLGRSQSPGHAPFRQQNRFENTLRTTSMRPATANVPRARLFTKPRVSSSSLSSSRSPLHSSDSAKTRTVRVKPSPELVASRQPVRAAMSASSSPNKVAQRPLIRDARLIYGKGKAGESDAHSQPQQTLSSDLSSAASSTDSKPEQRTPSSDGVGGARRVLVGTIRMIATAPARVRSEERDAENEVASIRPLISRNHQQATPLSREKSAARSRPMRRIGDYVSTHPSSQGTDGPATSSSSPAVRTHISPAFGHYEDAAKVASSVYPVREQQHDGDTRRANPVRQSRVKATTQQQPTHRRLPLSSVELSKITALHTRMNESGSAEKEVIVIRKLGEVRPPSPSSRFRRTAQSSQDDTDNDEGSMPGMWIQDSDARQNTKHAYGAGDEEPYTTPVRNVSLKRKSVRWHTTLFAGPSDVSSDASSHSYGHRKPFSKDIPSCLRASDTALDQYGNIPKAARARLAIFAPRIRITKIVYDDDGEEASD